jgi:hypothetical protein
MIKEKQIDRSREIGGSGLNNFCGKINEISEIRIEIIDTKKRRVR